MVILFQGGLNTHRDMVRRALWPSTALATIGVALSAAIVGAAAVVLIGVPWPAGLLLGAITAPTDAAAVSVLLRTTGIKLPARITATLELESGLNDPMSVFLTLSLVEVLQHGGTINLGHAAWTFFREMAGGVVIGVASGYLMQRVLRSVSLERSALPLVGFVAWAGLRGGVPIYLSAIPLLEGIRQGHTLFNGVFVAVIVSVAIQGWTAKPVARLLQVEQDPQAQRGMIEDARSA
jgi:cell volume regulation protein A